MKLLYDATQELVTEPQSGKAETAFPEPPSFDANQMAVDECNRKLEYLVARTAEIEALKSYLIESKDSRPEGVTHTLIFLIRDGKFNF